MRIPVRAASDIIRIRFNMTSFLSSAPAVAVATGARLELVGIVVAQINLDISDVGIDEVIMASRLSNDYAIGSVGSKGGTAAVATVYAIRLALFYSAIQLRFTTMRAPQWPALPLRRRR